MKIGIILKALVIWEVYIVCNSKLIDLWLINQCKHASMEQSHLCYQWYICAKIQDDKLETIFFNVPKLCKPS